MISKRYVFECDWCGYISIGAMDSKIKDFARNHLVYRFKSINPLADGMWIQSKPNKFAMKHIVFCCEECAEEYFKENPEDRKFYKLIK